MKILLTGFENFLDHPYNPTQKVANALNGSGIHTFILPVGFGSASQRIQELLGEEQWDLHISLGLAASRKVITPEALAINLIHNPNRPDNDQQCFFLTPIDPNGPQAIASTLNLRAIDQALTKQNIAHEISCSAGSYVCNAVMYQALWTLEQQKRKIPSGFIHLPPDKGFSDESQFELEELIEATRSLIQVAI